MGQPEFLIIKLKIVGTIGNSSLVTFDFRVLTTFLALYLQTNQLSNQN